MASRLSGLTLSGKPKSQAKKLSMGGLLEAVAERLDPLIAGDGARHFLVVFAPVILQSLLRTFPLLGQVGLRRQSFQRRQPRVVVITATVETNAFVQLVPHEGLHVDVIRRGRFPRF